MGTLYYERWALEGLRWGNYSLHLEHIGHFRGSRPLPEVWLWGHWMFLASLPSVGPSVMGTGPVVCHRSLEWVIDNEIY